jgi:hypothetical protein
MSEQHSIEDEIERLAYIAVGFAVLGWGRLANSRTTIDHTVTQIREQLASIGATIAPWLQK